MESPSILVTGAGRGIGRAIARRFAREGFRCVLCARSLHEIEALAREIQEQGGQALAVPMDVTDLSSVEAALARAFEFTSGRLNVLVNNAGVFDVKPFAEISPATWYRFLATNLNGPFHVTLLALKALEGTPGAHVFNIASTAAREPYPSNVAYGTTKYGLRGFSDCLRVDLADQGIRVSTVYPGATDTTIFDGVPGDWDRSLMNQPEDVAEVCWKAYASGAETNVDDLDVPPPGTNG